MCRLFAVELNSQYSQKVAELEQVIHQKLRERQKMYEEAFNQDMKNYLSTGYLHHRGNKYCQCCIMRGIIGYDLKNTYRLIEHHW